MLHSGYKPWHRSEAGYAKHVAFLALAKRASLNVLVYLEIFMSSAWIGPQGPLIYTEKYFYIFIYPYLDFF